jgi:hypothetical protein
MSPAGWPYSAVRRQVWPLRDPDADRVDLESRLIKLLLEDRARVCPFAGNGGSWRKADV